jgi:hypothetical protein
LENCRLDIRWRRQLLHPFAQSAVFSPTALLLEKIVGRRIAHRRVQIWGDHDDRPTTIAFMLSRPQDHGAAQGNAKYDNGLVCVLVQPLEDRAEIIDLLLQRHASCVLCRRGPTASLLPIAHQEVSFQIQTSLKLGHFVQHGKSRPGLNDQ